MAAEIDIDALISLLIDKNIITKEELWNKRCELLEKLQKSLYGISGSVST